MYYNGGKDDNKLLRYMFDSNLERELGVENFNLGQVGIFNYSWKWTDGSCIQWGFLWSPLHELITDSKIKCKEILTEINIITCD